MKKKILQGQRKWEPIICEYADVQCKNDRQCYGCDIISVLVKENEEKNMILAHEAKGLKNIMNIIKNMLEKE